MPQTEIPYLFMRGGTSRGPYFKRADLPEDRDQLSEILIAAIGAGHPLNINGIGGGAAVTTKVVMLSPSEDEDSDIDYFFAQVAVDEPLVDYRPTCGNMMSGVASAAVELGLFPASSPQTKIRIHAVNTGAKVDAIIETPNGKPEYAGDTAIDGVPGTAAPVRLNFKDVVGSVTGSLLPTGHARETINGIEVTCIDVAMPMVIARAADFGLTGLESAQELDDNKEFYARMEPIRREAGLRMGLGDVSESVTPKFGLLAPPQHGGSITARYFMPWACHPTMAVTGSQCLSACLLTPGTVAEGMVATPNASPVDLVIEHPSGHIDVCVDFKHGDNGFEIHSAGLVRTTRLLARGHLMIPQGVGCEISS